mmetsp:Transcript_5677/g.16813  ORF Transcript_5677/g.16813 Transcript_5677/m.16813 type:complete len:125 (-) Transcript_5677:142-516(-)
MSTTSSEMDAKEGFVAHHNGSSPTPCLKLCLSVPISAIGCSILPNQPERRFSRIDATSAVLDFRIPRSCRYIVYRRQLGGVHVVSWLCSSTVSTGCDWIASFGLENNMWLSLGQLTQLIQLFCG